MLILTINFFLLVAGFFLPPVAVILMTAPILLPIVIHAGFDPYWFAVMFTINMEIGLITPPVGLNLYVINSIAPDIPLATISEGGVTVHDLYGDRHFFAVLVPRYCHLAAQLHDGAGVMTSFFSDLLVAISERGRSLIDLRQTSPEPKGLYTIAKALLSQKGEASGIALASDFFSVYDGLDEFGA